MRLDRIPQGEWAILGKCPGTLKSKVSRCLLHAARIRGRISTISTSRDVFAQKCLPGVALILFTILELKYHKNHLMI